MLDVSWPFSIMVCVGMVCSTTILVSYFEFKNKQREEFKRELDAKRGVGN